MSHRPPRVPRSRWRSRAAPCGSSRDSCTSPPELALWTCADASDSSGQWKETVTMEMTLSHDVTTRLLRAADGLSPLHDAPDLFVRHSGQRRRVRAGSHRANRRDAGKPPDSARSCSIRSASSPTRRTSTSRSRSRCTSRTLVGGAGAHARDSESARGRPPADLASPNVTGVSRGPAAAPARGKPQAIGRSMRRGVAWLRRSATVEDLACRPRAHLEESCVGVGARAGRG